MPMSRKGRSVDRNSIPWLIAHRGARQEAPENTWSAFKKALTYPIDGIELDVQMSADGAPVLFHDRTLQKVAKQRVRVADMTLDQLNQLDWGAWFDPTFRNEPLLTLEKGLAKLAGCPHLLIEIKSRPADQSSGHAYDLTRRVTELITQAPNPAVSQRCLVLSFDSRVLAVARDHAPDLRYVLNMSEKEPMKAIKESAISPDHLWALCVKISRLSAPLVQWARSRRLQVFTYTCNGPRQVGKALKLKVDAIISDRPGWLTERIKGGSQV